MQGEQEKFRFCVILYEMDNIGSDYADKLNLNLEFDHLDFWRTQGSDNSTDALTTGKIQLL